LAQTPEGLLTPLGDLHKNDPLNSSRRPDDGAERRP
jgi:hypothetical protein